MRQPTLFLTVGLPCTGKTTAARRIEIEQEARLTQIGLRALELGNNVVIDYGLWSRDERSALRQAAADLGATVKLCYLLTPVSPSAAAPLPGSRQSPAGVGQTSRATNEIAPARSAAAVHAARTPRPRHGLIGCASRLVVA